MQNRAIHHNFLAIVAHAITLGKAPTSAGKKEIKMAKEWNEGRNCVFTKDYNSIKAGTGAWVFKVTKTHVTFKTKENETPSLTDVTIEEDQAENYVALKPGKPRKNWDFSNEKKASATVTKKLSNPAAPQKAKDFKLSDFGVSFVSSAKDDASDDESAPSGE